jgi:hypothetical protein
VVEERRTYSRSNFWLTFIILVFSSCLMSFQGVGLSLVQITVCRARLAHERTEKRRPRTGRATRETADVPRRADNDTADDSVAEMH